jgi:hypothetical protein
MKLRLIAAGIVLVGCACIGSAQTASSSSGNNPHYTREQLKQLIREAHTPSQYAALAAYYDGQRQDFQQKAAEEKVEWERRSQNIVSVAAKYPRPVDSARYLYEYYTQEASEAGSLSAKYGRLVSANGSASQQ